MQFKELRFADLIVVLVSFGSVFCGVVVAMFLLCRYSTCRLALFNIAAAYYMLLVVFVLYYLKVGTKFNWYFFMDSYREAVPTALAYVGTWYAVGLGIFLLGVYIFCLGLWRRMYHTICECGSKRLCLYCASTLLCFLLFMILFHIPTAHSFVMYNMRGDLHTNRDAIPTYFTDNSKFITDSRENVFIVQMESGNSLALSGRAVVNGEFYTGDYMPELRTIAKDGVFFPYFWGNSMQSHRGQASILCGIAGNLSKPFHYRPEEIPTPCLPEILQSSGYSTVFLRASNNPEFQNIASFVSSIGMEDVQVGDMMHADDPIVGMGYDDCTFVERSFEYLHNQYADPQGLFVYFEFIMNHAPFTSYSGYDDIRAFNPPQNFTEQYLNGALIQDHCMAKFYEAFNKYAPENTHLLILSDHSWPIGINGGNIANERGAYTENFLMPFVYIPPRSRREEFQIGAVTMTPNHSQTDIIPTIFELLNGTNYQNSFVYDLHHSGAPPPSSYEMCHVLVQPYDEMQIAVVKDLQKYTYHASTGMLEYADLSQDLLEREHTVIGENISYEDFINHYYCSRYIEEASQQIPFSSQNDTQSYSLYFSSNAGPSTMAVKSLKYRLPMSFTVEATVQPEDVAPTFVVSALQGSELGLGLGIDEKGYWFFGLRNNDGLAGVRSLQPADNGVTVHLAGVYDDDSVRLYVDGILQKETYVHPNIWHSYQPFFVGAVMKNIPWRKPLLVFHGHIDEVRFSNRAVYKKDFVPPDLLESNQYTLALFHFNEGYGDFVYDASGNNHHGYLVVGEKTHSFIEGITWAPQLLPANDL